MSWHTSWLFAVLMGTLGACSGEDEGSTGGAGGTPASGGTAGSPATGGGAGVPSGGAAGQAGMGGSAGVGGAAGTVGGQCTYEDVATGTCTITEITGAEPCPAAPVAVQFDFAPDTACATCPRSGNQSLRLQNMAVDSVHPCRYQRITQGSCTPSIFQFDDTCL